MLIPRFSMRLLLLVLTGCGGFFFVVQQALRGHAWAIGLSVALSSLLVTLVLHAGLFLGAWLLTIIRQRLTRRHISDSPFAAAKLPPQILPPSSPSS